MMMIMKGKNKKVSMINDKYILGYTRINIINYRKSFNCLSNLKIS